MIKTEMVGERIRHYSDEGLKIRQIETGALYDDAVDVMPCRYTYEETDEPIDTYDNIMEPQDALNVILGGR